MSDTPRDRWLRGACMCCGADLDWWTTGPEAVAEGVMMCGRCIENDHHLDSDVMPLLLECLVTGSDFP